MLVEKKYETLIDLVSQSASGHSGRPKLLRIVSTGAQLNAETGIKLWANVRSF